MAINSDRNATQLAFDFDAKLVESKAASVEASAANVVKFVPRSEQSNSSSDQNAVLSRLLEEAERLNW